MKPTNVITSLKGQHVLRPFGSIVGIIQLHTNICGYYIGSGIVSSSWQLQIIEIAISKKFPCPYID